MGKLSASRGKWPFIEMTTKRKCRLGRFDCILQKEGSVNWIRISFRERDTEPPYAVSYIVVGRQWWPFECNTQTCREMKMRKRVVHQEKEGKYL